VQLAAALGCRCRGIDDGYLTDEDAYFHNSLAGKSAVIEQICKAGMELADEYIINVNQIRASNAAIFSAVKKRCAELIQKHPAESLLFENFVKKQTEENDLLENRIVSSAMLIAGTRNTSNST